MEIQVKTSRPQAHARPLPHPLALLADRELVLFHGGCGGRISIDPGNSRDPESYATVRCNLCFETCREKHSLIGRALRDVLEGGEASERCTVIRFVPLSSREILVHSPMASRLQRYFQRRSRR